MSNLHRDLDEFNLHNPKGFNPATPNTFATKSEQGSSYYEERMQLPKVINIVDGNLPAPSTADLDAFIIIDGGGGVLDLSWGPSSFNDWVRFNGGVPYRISPLAGYLAYNENGSQWKEFDGSNWVDFGGGGVVNTLYTADGSLAGPRTVTMAGNSLTFDGGQTTIKGSGSTSGTTALLVQNSLSANLLEVLDNGHVTINGTPRVNNFVKFHAIGFGGKTPLSDATFNFRDWVFENNSNCLMSIVGNGSSSLEFIPTTTADSATIRASSTGLHIAASGGVYRYSYHKTKGHWFGDFSINQGSNFDSGVQWVFAPSGIGDMQLYAPDATALGTFNSPKLRLRASGYDTTTNTNEIKLQNITDTAGNYKLEVQDTANAALLTLLGNTGDLGIGVTPTAKLHVQGSGSTSGTTALLVQNSLSTNLLEVLDDGSTQINGVVGINMAATSLMSVNSTDISNQIDLRKSQVLQSRLGYINGGGGYLQLMNATATITEALIGFGADDYINTGGNFTIGASSGTSKLTVNSTDATDGIALRKSGSLQGTMAYSSSGGYLQLIDNVAASKMLIGFVGSDYINTGQNLGIGIVTPTAKLHVNGSTLLDGNLGVFGTTPIAQPTTAGGSALLSTGGGTGLTDTDTFDGYTLQQVVKALRDLGILA